MTSSQRRPPARVSRGLRVVETTDLRKLHLLLLAVIAMEAVDLSITLWRLIF